ncbi:MAG: MFS transporter [Ignavibacteriales bacterium]|nr:MFS transporter [Ignavibacteriales bacterium]
MVGLDPRLASFGGLAGVIWGAVNDPLIGLLTDRMRSALGRRRPFLLWFAVPFGLSFVILWSAPHLDNQAALLVYVTLTYMLMDTLQSLIYVPYLSLTPELASDYDERTSLTGFRSFFQLFGSLTVVLAAPNIVDRVLAAGFTQQQGYMLVGGDLWGHQRHPPAPDRHLRQGTGDPATDRSPAPARDPPHDVAEHPVPLRRGDPPVELVRGGYDRGGVPVLHAVLGGGGRPACHHPPAGVRPRL